MARARSWGRLTPKDSNAVIFKRRGTTVVIKRDAHTGRFATRKSAKMIDRAAARFAQALDRLAKR